MILNWQKNNSSRNEETRGTDRQQSPKGLLALVVAAFLLALACSSFFFQFARIYGPSMEPLLYHNNWVISSPKAYRNQDPSRGDVILFQRRSLTQGLIVKRVIGLPGETIEILDGRILVNGEPLQAEYGGVEETEDMPAVVVDSDSFFVLGDNRDHSIDSRSWEEPFVRKKELRGKVFYVFFPVLQKIDK